MKLLSKKLIAVMVILGIIITYRVVINKSITSVNGATVTSSPIVQITPTPRRATPIPSPAIIITIPPEYNVTFYIEKVADASEQDLSYGRFNLWSTQTGPATLNGYYRLKYSISGTATNGVDYLGRNYASNTYPLPGSILVKIGNGGPLPTGAEYDIIRVQPLADDLIEGTETVILTLTDVNVGPGMGSATLDITDGPIITPTPTPGVTGNYEVLYKTYSDWGNGASIDITIKNNTTTSVSGWTLAWTFPGNQTIVSLWNGTYTQSGASVSVINAAHNAIISAGGGSVSFGFNLNYSGSNANPTSFTLNGTPCLIQ